jgi:hypothetical protein
LSFTRYSLERHEMVSAGRGPKSARAADWQLGEMYWNGDGVKGDKISEYAFVYLAAGSGLAEARHEE